MMAMKPLSMWAMWIWATFYDIPTGVRNHRNTSESSGDTSKYIEVIGSRIENIEYEAFFTRRVVTNARAYSVDTPFVICSMSYIMRAV
jgi:hypothetical protein